mgnify:CR=1 FL=1
MDIMNKINSAEEYISLFSSEIQEQLISIRNIIQKAAPDAEEVISYGMPAYKQQNILVYFSGNKNHIGFYPAGSGISTFLPELTEYKTSKGTVQFPLHKKLPLALIRKMVKHRVQENLLKQKNRKK